jgi:hypothetical protein
MLDLRQFERLGPTLGENFNMKNLVAGLVCSVFVVTGSGAAKAITMLYSGQPATFEIGDTFNLDLNVSFYDALAGTKILRGYELTLGNQFDIDNVKVTGITSGGILGSGTSITTTATLPTFDTTFSEAALATTTDSTLEALQTDAFTLATLSLEVVALGDFHPFITAATFTFDTDDPIDVFFKQKKRAATKDPAIKEVAKKAKNLPGPPSFFLFLTGLAAFALSSKTGVFRRFLPIMRKGANA